MKSPEFKENTSWNLVLFFSLLWTSGVLVCCFLRDLTGCFGLPYKYYIIINIIFYTWPFQSKLQPFIIILSSAFSHWQTGVIPYFSQRVNRRLSNHNRGGNEKKEKLPFCREISETTNNRCCRMWRSFRPSLTDWTTC